MKTNLQLVFALICLNLIMAINLNGAWSDYILEEKGDTAVIKSFAQSGGTKNTIFHAVMGDTTATGERTNPNRVYETQRGQVYIYDGPAKIDATVPNLKIVAKDGTDQPPLHIKTTDPGGGLTRCFFEFTHSLYFENQYFCLAVTDNTLDRYGWNPKGEDQLVEFKNCIVELTNWAILGNWVTNMSVKFTDCLFINIGREASLEKGVIVDGESMLNEVYIENSTFLNFGAAVLCRPDAGVNMAYINHNTFVNSINNPFEFYSQAEQIVTNNLFVNTGIVADYPGFYTFYEDDDQLPKGIINIDTCEAAWKVDHWPDGYPVATEADRKVFCEWNNAWWDPRFTTMFNSQLPTPPTPWNDQKIVMNTRVKAMFDDDVNYPYFYEGTWTNIQPDFTTNEDIVDDWVSFIITNSTPGSPNGGDPQPVWRTNDETNLTQVDWPILCDLSYSDATLKSGGNGGYPIGDLNWFPGVKAIWEDAGGEYNAMVANMNAGEVGISERKLNSEILNIKAFPNPTTGITTVKFEMAKKSDTEIIIYNASGSKVKVLKDIYEKGIHEVEINMEGMDPGMYIIQLNTSYNNAGLTTRISLF